MYTREWLTDVPCFGFPSVDAYYDASSSRRKIADVAVPLLVVQAVDDPIAVHDAVPRDEIENNPHVVLVETESGGHLGWTAGIEAPFGSPWPDVGAMQFIEAIRARKKAIKTTTTMATSTTMTDGVAAAENAVVGGEGGSGDQNVTVSASASAQR